MAFVVSLEKKIEWKDGAFILCRKLSKAEDEAVEKLMADKEEGKQNLYRAFNRYYEIIRGWEGIEDESGVPLAYNETTKYAVYEMLVADKDFMERFMTWIRGPLGNLKTGLTSSLNGDGTPALAVNAS